MEPLRVLSSRIGWRIMSLKDSLTAVVTGSWNKDEDNSFLAVAIADFTHPSDRFIPTTRRELVGRLIQKNDIIAKNEEEKFEQFALALDGVLTSSHHQTLTDLKQYYDPLDPDKDTVSPRKVLERDRLDREFWLLRGLDGLTCKASYYELPRSYLNGLLQEHSTGEGVKVSVNPNNYATLRVWVRSLQDESRQTASRYQRVFGQVVDATRKQMGHKKDGLSNHMYKRVVLAVRHKAAEKLILKVFKEVRCSRLETLLPNGKIKMSNGMRAFLIATAGAAALGLAVRSFSYLGGMQWSYLLFFTSSLVGLRIWLSYRNRRNAYLVSLSRTLYYKSIAHNRGVLTLLVDRAVDEQFKQAILAYVCLLPTTEESLLSFRSGKPLDARDLDHKVAGWLKGTYGAPDIFNCTEALKNLEMLRLLKRDENGQLSVLPLEQALMILPSSPVCFSRWPQASIDEEDEKIELTGQTDVGKQETGWS